MTLQPLESQVIAKVAEDYRRRGCEVEVGPSGPSLPEFLEGFHPDLLARSAGDSVVVKVKVGTRTSVERLRDVVERVNRQPGWRFSLIFVSPDQPDQVYEGQPAPLPLSQERVRNAAALLQSGQREAAFLLLWSALEGILRLLGDRAGLPLASLPSSALIRELYSAGEISRGQFDLLLRLLPIQHRLVHGLEPQEGVEIEQLRPVVEALLAEARVA